MLTFRNFKFKPVFTWSPSEKKIRLFRIMFHNFYLTSDNKSYSWCIKFSLWPKLFHTDCSRYDKSITILGFRLHYKISYGGIIV